MGALKVLLRKLFVLPPGFEPGTTVPKTVVISISPWKRLNQEFTYLDEIREETMIFEEMYKRYINEKICCFDKEDRQIRKF